MGMLGLKSIRSQNLYIRRRGSLMSTTMMTGHGGTRFAPGVEEKKHILHGNQNYGLVYAHIHSVRHIGSFQES